VVVHDAVSLPSGRMSYANGQQPPPLWCCGKCGKKNNCCHKATLSRARGVFGFQVEGP
jgi:hypothetical protein